jgi:hypothetical protein
MFELNLTFVEGWTDPIVLGLIGVNPETHQESIIDLSNIATVALILTGTDGVAIDTSGAKFTVTDAPAGEVTYLPDSGDLVVAKSPYTARIKVTDNDNRDSFWPMLERMIWNVEAVT